MKHLIIRLIKPRIYRRAKNINKIKIARNNALLEINKLQANIDGIRDVLTSPDVTFNDGMISTSMMNKAFRYEDKITELKVQFGIE